MAKSKTLSMIGFFIDSLNIKTVAMAAALHVDASLISKWKSGKRILTDKSIYFDDVIDYLLTQNRNMGGNALEAAVQEICPQQELSDEQVLEQQLRTILSGAVEPQTRVPQFTAEWNKAVQTLIFEGNEGRREAVFRLLDYAEHMTAAGELVFLDLEEYEWLTQDSSYAKRFTRRMLKLLKKGFRAKFVIQNSTYQSGIQRLFHTASELIFHRNVAWYCCEYYDRNSINLSLFILNHAASLMGISVDGTESTSMLMMDSAAVIHHELFVEQMIRQSRQLFQEFEPCNFEEVLQGICAFHRIGAFYSYLPSPAFVTVRESLLREILTDNGMSEETVQQCLILNAHFRRDISHNQFEGNSSGKPFVYLFQLEEMERRAHSDTFVSWSLSLLSGRDVCVSRHQYAQELRDLADDMCTYNNMRVVFVSQNDDVVLPTINCWCKQNQWMVQMDRSGFRFSDEGEIVDAAANVLEECLKKIPPVRKDPKSVRKFLMEFADELEEKDKTIKEDSSFSVVPSAS